MANTHELRFSVQDVRNASGDRDMLCGLVMKELTVLAKRMKLDISMVLHVVEKAVERVIEEVKKFSSDPDRPYPPPGKHEMVLYVSMPEVGKLAQGVEYRERVIV